MTWTAEARRAYAAAHPDKIREYRRRRAAKYPERVAAQKRASNVRCRERVRRYHRAWEAKNREKLRVRNQEQRRRIRLEAIAAYGGRCACCGESQTEFLTIDHVYNDGAVERRGDRRLTGTKFYQRLKRLGWPKDRYQLLCFNCNCAKGHFGMCPHQRLRVVGAEV